MDGAIIILNKAALSMARQIQSCLQGEATIYALAGKIPDYKHEFTQLSDFVQKLYRQNRAIIAICASGIIIRALAPILGEAAREEPPVLSVAIDGSNIVPLLGVTSGANLLARQIGEALNMNVAITTSGELRFGLNLLTPPPDLQLVNRQDGKKFISRLLEGAGVRLTGASHDWLLNAHLPIDEEGQYQIHIALEDEEAKGSPRRLIYRLRQRVKTSAKPRGRVTIIGLGPGGAEQRTLAANMALRQADDILGYGFYVDMAGPFRPEQKLHRSDNKQELDRARAALDLARQGRHVALVSSGDAGVFGMAAAFFEVLETSECHHLDIPPHLDIIVEPGITAAMAASSRFGAPLGGDFAIISLSDNLKPQELIEKRLRLAAQADMALALYNPVSKARPHQIERIVTLLREVRAPTTPVGLGTDIGRPAEKILLTNLQQLRLADITSRTVILVGSSQSRVFHHGARHWFYTPRFVNLT